MPVDSPLELDQRPEARATSVEDLLSLVRAGRIRVPPFQRGLKWRHKHVAELLDSVYRGYPIGTLLFWEKPATADLVLIGPLRIDAGAREDTWWVVDGQQRISALAGTLLGSYADPTNTYSLYFDLETEGFRRPGTGAPVPPLWLPLHDVLDSERLLEWVHENRERLGEHLRKRAFRVGKRLREYSVATYIVRTAEERVLREIFDRTNSSGVSLSRPEVFDALHGADGAQPSGLAGIERTLDQELGFGKVGAELVLKSALALSYRDITKGFRQISEAEAPELLERTSRALHSAVGFVRGTAGIPHAGLLPYALPLVLLARFFDRFPTPHSRSLELMSRWLWRGAINGKHQGATVATRQSLQMLRLDESAAVQALLASVGGDPGQPIQPAPFNSRHARGKLLLLGLWELGPRELGTGQPLSVGQLMSRRPPAVPLIKFDSPVPHHARSVANYLLHPKVAGGLRRPLLEVTDPATLFSHGVDADGQRALALGDKEGFIERRERRLMEVAEGLLAKRARWADSDRPPIEALVVAD